MVDNVLARVDDTPSTSAHNDFFVVVAVIAFVAVLRVPNAVSMDHPLSLS